MFYQIVLQNTPHGYTDIVGEPWNTTNPTFIMMGVRTVMPLNFHMTETTCPHVTLMKQIKTVFNQAFIINDMYTKCQGKAAPVDILEAVY